MAAKLIVASGKSAGRSITVKHGKLLIGRAEECDIRPLGEEVSRRHCAVVEEAGGLTVEDLRSRNGTYVNGVKIETKVTVADGDIVRVGPLELKVSLAVPQAAPAVDDVSRWLMADDEPAGMFDTTQTVRVADVMPSPAAEPAPEANVPTTAPEPPAAKDDSSVSRAGLEALLAARAQPASLPVEARGQKANNSKEAAAEALRKFFGKR